MRWFRPPEATAAPPQEDDAARQAEFIERLARAIIARRLETPAVFFLEMNRPLGFLASQGVLLALPMLGLLVDPAEVERYARVLDSPENLDRLIARIEELAAERDAGAREDAA